MDLRREINRMYQESNGTRRPEEQTMIAPKKNPMPIIDLLPSELRRGSAGAEFSRGHQRSHRVREIPESRLKLGMVRDRRIPQDDDFLFFGFVIGLENEWGYFSLSELTEAPPGNFRSS